MHYPPFTTRQPATFCCTTNPHTRFHRSDVTGGKVSVSCATFVRYMLEQDTAHGDDQPLAIFDYHVLHQDSPAGDTLRSLYSTPDVPALDFRAQVLDRLPPELSPRTRYLLLGPTRAGTGMHRDFPAGTSSWNVVAHGRKRWAMLCPEASAAFAQRDIHGIEGEATTIAKWFVREWPSIRTEAAAAGLATFDFEHAAGEVVCVPPGWWHAVLNLEASVAISHTVLHRTRLAEALAPVSCGGDGDDGSDGMEATIDAAMDAFELSSTLVHTFDQATGDIVATDDVDERSKLAQWISSLRADGLLE